MTKAKNLFGSSEFFSELQRSLTADPQWKALAGGLSHSIIYNYGPPMNRAAFIRFDKGNLVEIQAEAYPCQRRADFVLTADGKVWKSICTRQLHIMVALGAGALDIQGTSRELLQQISVLSRLIDLQGESDVVFDC